MNLSKIIDTERFPLYAEVIAKLLLQIPSWVRIDMDECELQYCEALLTEILHKRDPTHTPTKEEYAILDAITKVISDLYLKRIKLNYVDCAVNVGPISVTLPSPSRTPIDIIYMGNRWEVEPSDYWKEVSSDKDGKRKFIPKTDTTESR